MILTTSLMMYRNVLFEVMLRRNVMVIMTMRMRLIKSLINLEKKKPSFNRITAVALLDSTNVQKLSQSENDESDYDDKVVEVEKKVLVPGELKYTIVIQNYSGLSEDMLMRIEMVIMTMKMRLTKSLMKLEREKSKS